MRHHSSTEIFDEAPIGRAPTSARRSAPIERVEVITRGARRRWSTMEKQAIVAESLVDGAIGAEICRRHDISSGQLSTWRRQCRSLALDKADAAIAVFARAVIEATPDPRPERVIPALHFQRSEAATAPRATPAGSDKPELPSAQRPRSRRRVSDAQIEIALPDGAVVRVGSAVDQAALSRVLTALRGR